METNLNKKDVEQENIENGTLDLKQKKGLKLSKKFLTLSVIVAIFLFLGTYFIFFYNNINGIWTTKSNDVDTYLNFRNDGTVSFRVSSVEVFGKYELKPDNKINIDIKLNSSDVLSGEFTYKMNSNFISRKLELKNSSGKVTEYTQGKEEEIKLPADFVPNDKILGTWFNKEYDLEYTFTNNGVIKRKSSNIIITLTYTIDDSNINFVQNQGKQSQENSIEYSFNGEKLILAGVEFDRK